MRVTHLSATLLAALLLTVAPPASADDLPAIQNGSMAAGATSVHGWTQTNADAGAVRAVRDTTDFAVGPASLRLESVGGAVEGGSVLQPLRGVRPGQRLGVRGRVKAEGVDFAVVTLLVPGAGDNWHELVSFAAKSKWTPFQAKVTVPDDAESAALMLFLHGEGRVWLDEVEIVDAAEIKASPVLEEFDRSMDFAYLGFDKAVTAENGALHITSKNGQGGTGRITTLDLSPFADWSPALRVKLGPKNEAKAIKMFFSAGEAKRMFTYDLSAAGPRDFVDLLPDDGLAVSPEASGEPDTSFDPAAINTLQVQGDWSKAPIDVFIDRIELVRPTPEMLKQREAYVARLVEKLERERLAEQKRLAEIEQLLIEGAPHPADGPVVRHICAVTPDTIALTIDAGEIVYQKQMPYIAQEGDEVRPDKRGEEDRVLCWEGGRIVDAPKGRYVYRQVDGRRRKLGALIEDGKTLAPGPQLVGQPLTDVTVHEPRAYRVGRLDEAEQAMQPPQDVWIKSKPTGTGEGGMSVRYHVYLRLAEPLEEGQSYAIELRGLNTRRQHVTFVHRPRSVRSEAIHGTQIGYRPSDPMKRAYLSLWRGTGGRTAYDDVKSFELLDANSGETVYRGPVELGFSAEEKESIRGDKNHTQTDVYYLDFSDFSAPGEYVVHVPAVGVSYPFALADDVWEQAFKTVMHGFLAHRSGIALERPWSDYARPRPMHPADGRPVFELDATYWNGEADAVNRSLRRLLGANFDGPQPATLPNAWGGYMDAGDWDRRSQHLTCTWEQLELLDLFPEYFENLKLALPPGEAEDDLPDVLNEALWNLDFYARLQRPDGGVGGGVESTAHPRPGEASWQESLLLGAFAPDPETSLRYAACAARAARLLQKFDRRLALRYRESAKRAWAWAEQHAENVIRAELAAEPGGRAKSPEKLRAAVQDMRALAAVALYRLTEDAAYHRAFLESSALAIDGADLGGQMHAVFAYACLPGNLADAELQRKAVAWFEQAAADSLAFADKNAFQITCRVPLLPVIGYVGYYSVPETVIGGVLPRAHYLTGDTRYLRGALAATQFSAGANPMNMTLTTGLGHAYPRHPLHIDSRHAGIAPPRGILVYGNSDPALADGSMDWVHTWYLNKTMVPRSRTWPSSEFFVDLGNAPPMNEYTVHQQFRPASFYWGYLAARR